MKSGVKSRSVLPIKSFKEKGDWAAWLKHHHAKSPGLWLRIDKKTAEIRSITYPEALDIALCYGWIDGQKKTYDEFTWLQKFTSRGARSIWSVNNREKAGELIRKGQMSPAGQKVIERAKENGQWAAAYASQSKITLPEDFQAELENNTKAKAFFNSLNSANRYAILFRLQTARKPETRAKRLRQFIAMLEKHEKFR